MLLPSRFGFGTSGIMGAALSRSGRLRLLETAFDQGIHHFDTAPLYGQGEAEALLGVFARGRRERITITTKFGLLPTPRPALLRPLLPLARIVNRRLWIPLQQRHRRGPAARGIRGEQPPHARENASNGLPPAGPSEPTGPSAASATEPSPAPLPAPPQPAVPYTPAVLRQQVERSLRALQSDWIDYYLLHECQLPFLNEGVLACLDELVREGKVRHVGLGSGRGASRQILEAHPQRPWIVQIPDRWHDADTAWFAQRGTPPLFTHSALRLGHSAGEATAETLRRHWAAITGQPPQRAGLLSELLLAIALESNPQGCVLFSSRHRAHIEANGLLPARQAELAPAVAELRRAMGVPEPAPDPAPAPAPVPAPSDGLAPG